MRALVVAAALTLALISAGFAASSQAERRSERAAELVWRRAIGNELQRLHRVVERQRAVLRHRPSVQEAITLGAVLFGVDRQRMSAVMWRESRHRPWAKNPRSTAAGLSQFLDSTWASTPCGRAGLSVYSAYANAACMGWYVAHYGWSAWSTG